MLRHWMAPQPGKRGARQSGIQGSHALTTPDPNNLEGRGDRINGSVQIPTCSATARTKVVSVQGGKIRNQVFDTK